MVSDRMDDPFLRALSLSEPLPLAIQELHCQPGVFSGRCHVERGRGMLIELALRIGRFPRSGMDQPVTLVTQIRGTRWIWSRDFAGHKTRSELSYDAGRDCVIERIGGLTIRMRPVVSQGVISIEIIGLKVFGLPCPASLLPRSVSCEWQDEEGRFRFDVSASLPWLGRLIRYHGWLTRDHEHHNFT